MIGQEHVPLTPQSLESERAVIGCVLRCNALISDARAILRLTDFYADCNRRVWDGLCTLVDQSKPADLVTLANWLKERGWIADVGGYQYLAALWDAAPVVGHVEHYAKVVRDAAIRRDLIEASAQIQRDAFDMGDDTAKILERSEQRLFAVSQRSFTSELTSMQDAMREAMEALQRRCGRSENGEVDDPVKTGWLDLDRQLGGGLHKRELTILAARPSVGKTLVAANIIANACEDGKRVFFASLEQHKTEVIHRWICQKARVNSYTMRSGKLTDEQILDIGEVANAMGSYKLFFDDSGCQSATRVMSNARRLQMKTGLDLVVVDYLQIMEPESRHAKRYEQVGFSALRMKQLAKELNIPVLVLAQLNRGIEQRTNKKPMLSDLKESGDIEQHGDCIMMLHKPEDPDPERKVDLLEVVVGKQRNGPLGDVKLSHVKRFFEVCNYDEDAARDGYKT